MSAIQVLAAAVPGDVLTITAGGKTKSVTVTHIDGRYLFTTSGKVRPGNFSGGMIDTHWGTFQPTMQQQARTIESVARCAVLSFPAK